MITEIENISNILDGSKKVEQRIQNGPRGDYEQYGKTLKEIGRSKRYLKKNGASFKAAPKAFAQLDKLEFTGKIKCDDALVTLISKVSVPHEPEGVFAKIKNPDNPEIPKTLRIPISKEKLSEIQTLAEALQQYPNEIFKWEREFLINRKSYLLHSLQKLKTSQQLNEYISETKRKAGTMHPFIKLYVAFIPLLEGEKLLSKQMFPKQFETVFCTISEPSVDYFIETGELLIKCYQNLSVFLRSPLLDVLVYLREKMNRLQNIFEFTIKSKLLVDIENFLIRIEEKIKNSFLQISDEIKKSNFVIRDSATVDQLTSNVLSFLTNISKHKEIICKLLFSSKNSNSSDEFLQCILSILNDLIQGIIQRANDEKNITLKAIYVLNNIQYIQNKLKVSEFHSIIPSSFYEKCEKDIRQFSTTYKTA